MNKEQRKAFRSPVAEPEELNGVASYFRLGDCDFSYQLFFHVGKS